MTARSFTDRKFQEPKPEHKSLGYLSADQFTSTHGDLDDSKYDWEFFGKDKYGRYAVCRNTNIKRGLTMGEFYGSSTVD